MAGSALRITSRVTGSSALRFELAFDFVADFFRRTVICDLGLLAGGHCGCGELGLLPLPLAEEGWGGGSHKDWCLHALSLSLPRKRGRGRCGTDLRNQFESSGSR